MKRGFILRTLLSKSVLLLSLFGLVGCGGYDATAPGTVTAEPPAGAYVIDVVAINGDQSYSPNPATVPLGQMVTWHNVDTIVHRVVTDGGDDTGNLAPGAYSTPMLLRQAGSYHCSIHPPMVGTVRSQ
jgi:plastocyanin